MEFAVSLLTAAVMLVICDSQRLGTHSKVSRCGDVGGVERIQSASASHVQQPGLLLQQQGAVVPGRAGETSTAQQTCRDTTHIITRASFFFDAFIFQKIFYIIHSTGPKVFNMSRYKQKLHFTLLESTHA